MNSQMNRYIGLGLEWSGASAPMELGAVTSWKGCAWNLEASLSESHSPGILMEASSRRRDQSLTPFSALLKRMVIEAENSKFLIMACSFWWPDLIWETIQSPPTVTSLEQETLLLPRKLQEFQDLCARNPGHRPIYILYYLTLAHAIFFFARSLWDH